MIKNKRPSGQIERYLLLVLIGWISILVILTVIRNSVIAQSIGFLIVCIGITAVLASLLKNDWRLWLVATIASAISATTLLFAYENVLDIITFEALCLAAVVIGFYRMHITRKKQQSTS